MYEFNYFRERKKQNKEKIWRVNINEINVDERGVHLLVVLANFFNILIILESQSLDDGLGSIKKV